MYSFYKIAATFFMAAILFSCKTQKTEVEVKLAGEIRTRRTFASIQSINDEKERERYIAEQEKSNPTLDGCCYTATDSLLIEQFEKLGLIKNDEFIEAEFKPQTKPLTVFTDRAKKVYPLHFYYDNLTSSTHFKIYFSKDSVDVDTKATPLQDLDYAFMDVIPGGNKELVFLDDYYIMNGYNFDFKVYEIKSN